MTDPPPTEAPVSGTTVDAFIAAIRAADGANLLLVGSDITPDEGTHLAVVPPDGLTSDHFAALRLVRRVYILPQTLPTEQAVRLASAALIQGVCTYIASDASATATAHAEAAAAWVIREIVSQYDITTATGRDDAIDDCLRLIHHLPSGVQATDALLALAEAVGMAREAFSSALVEMDTQARREAQREAARRTAEALANWADGEDERDIMMILDQARGAVAHTSGVALPSPADAEELAATAASPQDWVLPEALPAREAGLLVGGDGTGKSLLAMLAAISVACGIPWAGGLLPAPSTTGRVVYLAGEDDVEELHRRLRAIVARLSADLPPDALRGLRHIDFHPLEGHPTPLLAANRQAADPEETPWVAAMQEVIQGARLLILDPLVMFHSVNENDNQHMDRLMRCILRIVRTTPSCAALVVHHAGQGSVRDGADDAMVARGATALHSAARAVFAVRRLTTAEAEKVGEAHRLYRAVRGPKISRAQDRPVAYVRFGPDGVPMMVDWPSTSPKLREVRYGGR